MLRRCCECGREKPPEKFYRDTPDCKWCHNKMPATLARRSRECLERQLGDPTPEQILAICEVLRADWSPKKLKSRRSKIA
jgi:hypothetical protein